MAAPNRSAALAGVYAKIDRAREHSDFLKAQFDPFVEDNPDTAWGYTTQVDTENGELIVRWRGTGAAPLSWAVILGEFFHNIRSALDHIVCALVGGTNCDGTAFIIRETESDFDSLAQTRLDGIPPGPLAVIKKLQLFNAWPEHPKHSHIWKINELANRDKHRLLLLSDLYLISQEGNIAFLGTAPEVKQHLVARHKRLVDGTKLLHFTWDANEVKRVNPTHKMKVEFRLSMDVSLIDGDWLDVRGQAAEGMPLRHLMDGALKYMEGTVLPEFEPFF